MLPANVIETAAIGRWRDAWQAVRPHWTAVVTDGGCAEVAFLHELSLRLGLDTRRRWLERVLRRRHRERLQARTIGVLDLLRRESLLEAWEAIRSPVPDPLDASEELGWLLCRARVHSHLRDHDSSQRLLDAARALAPENPLVDMEIGWACQDRDRLDEGIATCRLARQRYPEHPLLRLQECWLLHDANDPGVSSVMAAARQCVQSPHLDSVYANHRLEAGDLATARAVWKAMLDEPFHERPARTILRFALLRACRQAGDDAEALAHAEAAGRAGAATAARLRAHVAAGSPPESRRVVLPVPFVRQDHLTCSPATMASLLRTFGLVVDQREIAAQITYDGTASHDELEWAHGRGLHVHFFQFAAETARTLLDRGLPFAVTTRFETNGHRQAVVGYDRVLDTFLLRDPTGNFRREVDATWLDMVARRGGECSLLLPADVAARTELPPLPQEEATMEALRLQLDWRHRRLADAERRIEALLAEPPGPLRFDVELRVCRERGDRRRQLELYESAFAAASDDPYWQFHWVAELMDRDRWQQARELLERLVPTTRSPHLRRLLADHWRHDARRRPEALRLMRRALRLLGRDSRAWNRYAGMLWDDPGQRETATEAFRIAAGLAPHDEWLATCYFDALHQRGRTESGLAFLRDRAQRFGARSPAPAATLARALARVHRPGEAIDVLRAGVAGRAAPDEHELLFDLLLQNHRLDDAAALLEDGAGMRPIDRAMCRHRLARLRSDHDTARAALEQCITIDPCHVRAQSLRLDDVLERDGAPAAVAAADALIAVHGEDPALMVAVAEFFARVEERGRGEALLRRLVAEHPHEHWLRGRLARLLVTTGQIEAARPLLDELRVAAPDASAVWADIAEMEHASGRHAAARAAARRALELQPDDGYTLRRLVDRAPDAATAADDVRFAMELVRARPVPPDRSLLQGLLGVADAVPVAEVEAFLDGLEQAFPGTSEPTVARCEFTLRRQPAAALLLAIALTEREPWRTDHALRRAACLRALQRRAEEREVLERLLAQDPGCAQAWVELGESFDQEGRLQQAKTAYERGLVAHPGYAVLHGMLADVAWRLGDRDGALAAVSRACDLDRGYAWAMHARVRWLHELDRSAEALAFAESLVAASPRWVTGHELHAAALGAVGRHAERIVALQRALEIAPRVRGPRERLVDALIELRRFDEARAVVAEGKVLRGDDPGLLVQELRIDREAGEFAASRERLRELLQRFPDHEDGWFRYLSWCEQEGRHTDILTVYRAPPQVLQNAAVLFGYAADAMRSRSDLAGAETALRRALELDPGYSWARTTLCAVALERGAPATVLELLPDHGTPESLPFQLAVLVAKACVRLGRFDLGTSTFARMLRDPQATTTDLCEVDKALRRQREAEHDEQLRRVVAGAAPASVLAQNHLRVLTGRRDSQAFWRGLEAVQAALPFDRAHVVVAELLADVRGLWTPPGLAAWVRQHVRGPVVDTEAMGHYLFALADAPEGAVECVRLFRDDWRRPDVRGWMLANLADALFRTGDFALLDVVCRHALDHVPADHSRWWHRRYLAEIALRERRYADVRRLCEMPVDEQPSVRLDLHQLDLVAHLRLTAWWRRGALLRRRCKEMLRRYDAAAAASATTPSSLRPGLLLRACPGLLPLLLHWRWGLRLVRAYSG